jgi:hypothetical protein
MLLVAGLFVVWAGASLVVMSWCVAAARGDRTSRALPAFRARRLSRSARRRAICEAEAHEITVRRLTH